MRKKFNLVFGKTRPFLKTFRKKNDEIFCSKRLGLGLIPVLIAYTFAFGDLLISQKEFFLSKARTTFLPKEEATFLPKEEATFLSKAKTAPSSKPDLQVPLPPRLQKEGGDVFVDSGPWNETLEIGEGETLKGVLKKVGIASTESHEAISALKPLFNPRDLRTGQEVSIRYEKNTGGDRDKKPHNLLEISLQPDVSYVVRVVRQKDGAFKSKREEKELTYQNVAIQGTISESLYRDALKEGASPQILYEMIRAFSYDVNFQLDFQPGDRFLLFYQEAVDEETGRTCPKGLFFAALVLGDKTHKIYRFQHEKGQPQFYTEKGTSVRKDLLKTPVDGARLSSRFGRRRHPTLGYTKMHKGVDFAAPLGTPVMAAGNGVIEKAGPNKSYGHYVLIRHDSGYKTAYAHLSRYARGIRPGKRVKQGEIIAYIGSTGRSTGPHLHFEVIKRGAQINPQLIKLMPGKSLSGKELQAFKSYIQNVNNNFKVALDRGGED